MDGVTSFFFFLTQISKLVNSQILWSFALLQFTKEVFFFHRQISLYELYPRRLYDPTAERHTHHSYVLNSHKSNA